MKPISQAIKSVIISLIEIGYSIGSIGTKTGVGKSNVRRMHNTYILLQRQLDNGRHRTLSSCQEQNITRFVQNRKVLTAVEVRNFIEGSKIASVSANTIWIALRRRGLN